MGVSGHKRKVGQVTSPPLLQRRRSLPPLNSMHGPSTASHPTTVAAALPLAGDAADLTCAFPPRLRPACIVALQLQVASPRKRPRVLRQETPLACLLASCPLARGIKRDLACPSASCIVSLDDIGDSESNRFVSIIKQIRRAPA